MGWMRPFEQQQVLSLYLRHAEFRCDYCKQPIYIDELHVEDPKKGYFPKEEGTPSFLPKKPKWTIHLHPCNDYLLGKRREYSDERGRKIIIKSKQESPKVKKKVLPIAERILDEMRQKKKVKWNVAKVLQTLREKTLKHNFKASLIRRAIRYLKATDQIVKKNGHLYVRKQQNSKG